MSEAGPASESSPNDNKDTPLDHLKEHQEEDGQAENTEETMDQNLDKETANADASQEQTEESEDKEEENQKETTSAEDNDNQMGDELEVPKLSSTVYDAAFEEEPSAVEDTPTVVNSSAVEDTPAIVNSSAVEDTPGVVNSSAVEDTPNVVDSLAVEDTLIAGVSSTVEESIAVDDVSVLAVRDTPNEDSTSFLQNKINEDESSEVQDTPGVEEPSTVEKLPVAADAMDSPVVDNSPVPKEPVEDPPEVDESFNLMVEDSHVEEGSPLSDDLVTETNNNENVEGAEGVSLTENDQSQTESQPMHEDNEVDKNDDAKTEEKRTRMQLDEDDDKLLADEESLKANAEDGKQEDQDNVAEDKLLADSENQESSELMENSENNSGNEEKFNQSKPNEDEDSTGDIQLQIGSVTGNAEMVDDSEVMEVDQDSTPKDEDSSKVTEVAEEKKDGDDDVEMIEADEKEDEKEVIDIKDDDVEMKEDGNKQNESTAEAQKIKTEQEEKPEDTKPIVDDDDDDDDVKIIDVQSKDNSKAKEVKVKDENKDAVSNGEMCLQIASVSGGVDMPEQNFDDKKEEKKDSDTKVKEETGSKDIKQEPKSGESKSKSTSKIQTCIVCQKIGKCKYNIVRNGDVKHLCDDTCFKQFRANPTMFLRASTDNQVTKKPDSPAQAPPPNVPSPGQERYKTCSICQLMNVKTSKPFLNWQCMDFCGEDCLGKFQAGLNAACNYCGQTVPQASKAKFCARVDDNVKQFCSAPCYNEFKKRQKLCEYCQKDVTKISDAFVAPVGKEALFKDFCSQGCLQKYEAKSNDVEIVGVDRPQKSQVPPKGNFQCAVCRKTGPVKHEIKLEGKMNRLCGDPCFSAFQYANKLTMNTCDNCGVYCYNEGMAPQYIQFEGQQKRFCSFMCVNTFKTLNKKVVSCAWCNCKKSNFDMIERVDANNKYQLFCSLNCLSLYRVNLQATSNQAVVCDQCRKFVPAQYHLTMSDASVRNFCSYQCVMTFQSQFAGGAGKSQTPIMNTAPQNQKSTPARTPARNTPTRASARANTTQQKQANVPVISNVVSLSTQIAGSQQQTVRSNQMPALTNSQSQPRSSVTNTSMQTPPQQIIIQPPPPKTVKNKSLLCKPFVQTKATSCRPHTQTKETQTDESAPKQMVIPIPIPYYIPVPMMMYTQYTPVPLPIPVPIPVPCFIPTTKKSSSSIFKHIKEIQERIPSDPLEAELLMMAEAVAVADPESDSDTENEDILPASKMLTGDGDTLSNSPSPIPDPVPEVTPAPGQSNGEFGEDMLQMALRMATEMTSEPVMDLESSIDPVPVNTGKGRRRKSSEKINSRSPKNKHFENIETFSELSKGNVSMVKAMDCNENTSNNSNQSNVRNLCLQIKEVTSESRKKDLQDVTRNLSKHVQAESSEEISLSFFETPDMEYVKGVQISLSDRKDIMNQDCHTWNMCKMNSNVQTLDMDMDFDQHSEECVLEMEASSEEYRYVLMPSDDSETDTAETEAFEARSSVLEDEVDKFVHFLPRPVVPTQTDYSLVSIHPQLQNLRNQMILDAQNPNKKGSSNIKGKDTSDSSMIESSHFEVYDKSDQECKQMLDFQTKSETECCFKIDIREPSTTVYLPLKKEESFMQKSSVKQSPNSHGEFSANTMSCTRRSVRYLKDWCKQTDMCEDLSVISTADLAMALELFYTDKKQSYQKLSMLNMRSSLKRYFWHIGRTDIDIVKDPEFRRANGVINSMSKPDLQTKRRRGLKKKTQSTRLPFHKAYITLWVYIP